jgi:hypothetical protein
MEKKKPKKERAVRRDKRIILLKLSSNMYMVTSV